VRGEDRATCATGDAGNARERGEAADGDDDGREGGHHLGVLGREEIERVAGVEEPDRRLCYRRGDCEREPRVRTHGYYRVWVRARGIACVPSPWEAAGTGTGGAGTTAAAGVVVGAGVGFEEVEVEGNGIFQKPEELVGSTLTTSLLLSAVVREAFEGERLSQVVARLFAAGFSPSVFSD